MKKDDIEQAVKCATDDAVDDRIEWLYKRENAHMQPAVGYYDEKQAACKVVTNNLYGLTGWT